MKKLLYIFIAIMTAVLCSCGQNQGNFIATVENINFVISENNLSYTIDELNKNGAGTVDTEVSYYCQLKDIGVDSKTKALINFHYKDGKCDKIVFTNLSLTENFENDLLIIDLICDFYGANSRRIQNKVRKSLENKENYNYTSLSSIRVNFEYKELVIGAVFAPGGEGSDDYSLERLKLVGFTITDKEAYIKAEEESERMLQEIISANPYLYTNELLSYPDPYTNDEINNIFSSRNIPFSAELYKDDVYVYGYATYQYRIYFENEQCADVYISHYPAGKSIRFTYDTFGSDYYNLDSANKDAVATACRLFGSSGYIEEILKEINEYEFDPDSSLYIKCDDLYISGTFNYLIEEQKVRIFSIELYEPDVFKGVLIKSKAYSQSSREAYKKYFE